MENCVGGESMRPGFRSEHFGPCCVLKATLISLLNVEKQFFFFFLPFQRRDYKELWLFSRWIIESSAWKKALEIVYSASQYNDSLYFYCSGWSGLIYHAHIFWLHDECSAIRTSESTSKQSRSSDARVMLTFMLFKCHITDLLLSSMEFTLSHCDSCFLEPYTSLFSRYFLVILPKH